MDQGPRCLAVDIGGTKIALAVFDPAGQPVTPVQTAPVTFDALGSADPAGLIAIIRSYLAEQNICPADLLSVGVSLCGNVDLQTGEATLTPNLHWRNVPFGSMLADALKIPVIPATDVRDAALAEHCWGAARGVNFFAWCTVGTGYGGYLFLDGKLYDGVHGFAGPFGHSTIDEINGALCGCGRRGCVETYVSGPAIARQGQRALSEGRSQFLADLSSGGSVSTAQVFQAAEMGDPTCQEIIDGAIRGICINLSGLVNTLDLEMIVLGGGVSHAAVDFVSRIDTRIRPYLMSAESRRDLRVVAETFDNSALVGAAGDAFLRIGVPIEPRRAG
jgi:glucokinase